MAVKGKRLDMELTDRGLAPSREKARAMILAGVVIVNDQLCDKPATPVSADSDIRVRGKVSKYVSRGGDKLEGALRDFKFDPTGLNAIDLGASTGGFTDCLLKHGAAHVTAVDVGYGQLDMSLRSDPRVRVLEKTNARYLQPGDFEIRFDLAVIDASFISLLKILSTAKELVSENAAVIALVKPQFEAGRERLGKGGVVRKPEDHTAILEEVISGVSEMGLAAEALTFSVAPGPKGNLEFFLLIRKSAGECPPLPVESVVRLAHDTLLKPSTAKIESDSPEA